MLSFRLVIPLLLSAAPFCAAIAQEEVLSYYDMSPSARTRLGTVEKYHLGKAIANVREGQWQLAMAECEFILGYFPDHPQGLLIMVKAGLASGESDEVEPYFQRAMDQFPSSVTTFSIYGNFKQQLGEFDQAVKAYKKALEIDPNYSEAHYNLGLAYARMGRLEEANAHAQAAYRLGFPLPGLRRVLEGKGAWSELPDEQLQTLFAPEATK